MTKLVEKTKAIRKTFTIPSYIVKELESYAKEHNQKQSQIVADILEQYLAKETGSKKVQKRVDALQNLVGIAPKGSIANLTNNEIKAARADKYAH